MTDDRDALPAPSSAVPVVIDRPSVPYVAVRCRLPRAEVGRALDELPALLAWAAAHSLHPAGPPFLRTLLAEAAGDVVVECGVPVDDAVHLPSDAVVTPGELPAGRYLVTTHVGPPEELPDVEATLLGQATTSGRHPDAVEDSGGTRWACLLELQLRDPRIEPESARWETQLAVLLAADGSETPSR